MQGSSDVTQFLEELRMENGRHIWSLKSFNRYLDRKAREMGVPLTGQFELTPLCNLNCKMCYVHLAADQMKQVVLPVETWKNIMYQAWKEGMLHVTLSGGECLTYPGFDELYLYLQNLGCDISILTNGYLLDEKRISFLLKHKPSMIQVTLYGWNDDVYERVTGKRAFTKVAENIQNAVKAGLFVRLVVSPSKYLGEDVLETIRVARSFTREVVINSTIFPPREETGRSDQRDSVDMDLYVRIFRLMKELDGLDTKEIDPNVLPQPGGSDHECDQCGLLCGGGRSGFAVDWKGNLMPCNGLDMIQASVLDGGFREAWKKIHREVTAWPCVPECRGCAYFEVCHRCAAIMIMYAERGKQPVQMCEQIRYLVQHGVMHIPDCE